MHNGVELKLVCTKYLKKIPNTHHPRIQDKISKTKISRAHMKHNISRAFIPKNSKAIHKKKNLKITHEQNLHEKLQWAKSKEMESRELEWSF